MGGDNSINGDLKWFDEIDLLGLGETFWYKAKFSYLVIPSIAEGS